MKGTSGVMGGLYRICEWIMRFTIINVLWIVFNIPIVFIVLNTLFMAQKGAIAISLVPLIILLPLLFFPATTAMFASARDWVMEEDTVSIRKYWRYYKENYIKSLVGGLVLTGAWTIWAVDYYYFSKENIILMGIFLLMGILLFVFTINFFSVLSHYHMELLTALKNALFLTIGSPVLFLTILISNGILLYLSLNVFWFMLPFFSGALMAYLSFSAFYRYYLKVVDLEKK
jgi:uncharacterized membrane protein YesL